MTPLQYFRIWPIPNERVDDFTWIGKIECCPFEVRPIPLNDSEHMLPYVIAMEPLPSDFLDKFRDIISREITKEEITA